MIISVHSVSLSDFVNVDFACHLFQVLHVLAAVGMWALIKDKEDKGDDYASSQKLFAYGSALLGTTWALVFGSGFVSQTDGWAVTSDLLLPVVIPVRPLLPLRLLYYVTTIEHRLALLFCLLPMALQNSQSYFFLHIILCLCTTAHSH